jgi:hypothetical protein
MIEEGLFYFGVFDGEMFMMSRIVTRIVTCKEARALGFEY